MQFYNPSKIITDVLSKYLEFDPEQLKLGIWSGNLSIQDVELKRNAMYPLLNDSSLPKQDGKPPLKLKLVKGTVGQMRIRIPWKRLVWGQGDVKLQISDVTIAVAYESREETAARNLPKEQETPQKKEKEEEDDEESKKRKRDLKQEWLREAERCQLQGNTLPSMKDIAENGEEESAAADGKTSGAASKGHLDKWLKNTTESFAWRFVAGLQASIRNVRVVIVQDGVEIGTIFHSMDIIPKSLDALNTAEEDQQDAELSGETPADITVATPPPDVVPEGEYEDGEHLDKIVKLQGFGVFVRREDRRNKSPKTLAFSTSVAADDYILRPTEGNLAISIFDPYPLGKQRKKKVPTIEEEPTTPTTATATVDSVTSSKSRRSKREKRPLVVPDEGHVDTASETLGSAAGDSDRPSKQLRPALKRPGVISTSTRQFSIAEIPAAPGNRPKSHTVDLSRATGSAGHTRGKSTLSRANLSRVSTTGHRRRISNVSGRSGTRSIPLLPTDDTSTIQTPIASDGMAGKPPSLDLHLSFGDVTTMFSSRHYKLILTFKSTVERMKNGRPDKTIGSCFGELGPDKKRSVYVDAPTSAVKNVNDNALRSQLPPSALKSSRPSIAQRARTTGGVDFSSEPPQRVQLHLQLELPSLRDKNKKVVQEWWQYAYSTALYEIRDRRAEESSFNRKHLRFDWEKQTLKRKEYVELYIATRLEPSSVLRSMEMKVKLGTKSPEEELLKIEDELPVEQILLYRSIARSVRVRGMRTMPSSVLKLHGEHWLKGSPGWKKTGASNAAPFSTPASPGASSVPSDSSALQSELDETIDAVCLVEVRPESTDINAIRREAEAVRMRTSVSGDSQRRKANLKRLLSENIGENLASQKVEGAEKATRFIAHHASSTEGGSEVKQDTVSTNRADRSDGRTVRSFKTAKTSQTSATTGVHEREASVGNLRISVSVTFSNVELMVYQENANLGGDSTDSMRFRPASSGLSASGVLDTRIRSTAGLQVITSYASSSDMSDVSILSDDQQFFEQHHDTSSIPDGESVGDVPIMSSADFLMFGLPRDILLRATISGLVGKTRGQSGGQQMLSLAVDNVSINGDKDCQLLSLKPTTANAPRPLDEVHIEKKKKKPAKKGSAVSFSELEMFQEQAILVSAVSMQMGTQLRCDLSKAIVSCDLQATVKIYDFFCSVDAAFPQPLIAQTRVEELRQCVLKRLSTVKQGLNNADGGVSSAIRLHGLEICIPGRGDDDSLSRKDSGSSPDAVVTNNKGANAKISLNLIEYYDGLLFEDILSIADDYAEEGSWKSNEKPLSMSDRGWQRRNLNMIDVTKLVDGHYPSTSKHAVRSRRDECEFLLCNVALPSFLPCVVDFCVRNRVLCF